MCAYYLKQYFCGSYISFLIKKPKRIKKTLLIRYKTPKGNILTFRMSGPAVCVRETINFDNILGPLVFGYPDKLRSVKYYTVNREYIRFYTKIHSDTDFNSVPNCMGTVYIHTSAAVSWDIFLPKTKRE